MFTKMLLVPEEIKLDYDPFSRVLKIDFRDSDKVVELSRLLYLAAKSAYTEEIYK